MYYVVYESSPRCYRFQKDPYKSLDTEVKDDDDDDDCHSDWVLDVQPVPRRALATAATISGALSASDTSLAEGRSLGFPVHMR